MGRSHYVGMKCARSSRNRRGRLTALAPSLFLAICTVLAPGGTPPLGASPIIDPPGPDGVSISLVYAARGLALVGTAAGAPGLAQSAHLYISTDLVHWRQVTPPRADSKNPMQSGNFEAASFLNEDTGWVTTSNGAMAEVTIYRTDDGGRSWTWALGAFTAWARDR